MKYFEFKIGHWDFDEIFAPIRTKEQCIKLLMKTLKIITVNDEIDEENEAALLILVVSKMSRLFYISENKYFSINFPFQVAENDGKIDRFYSKYIPNIDSAITSQVLAVISNLENFESDCVLTFSEGIEEAGYLTPYFWPFLKELMMFEEGYIRYDCDALNENGLLHPLNHYDIFYSSNVTFKVGLKEAIDHKTLVDLLKLESNCHFIELQ